MVLQHACPGAACRASASRIVGGEAGRDFEENPEIFSWLFSALFAGYACIENGRQCVRDEQVFRSLKQFVRSKKYTAGRIATHCSVRPRRRRRSRRDGPDGRLACTGEWENEINKTLYRFAKYLNK
ncbi:hypothetical protein [Burkholderia stagnalis]|uniref:Uncharacterized protein n=1 Tax=Burkholderia stagnalis TaxID=1503054 RepID=A0A6L3N6I7_9BURK|nr:hypothetical protein [Burkholderia stagnalis]KAB0641471.1 hypothetical protein F7R25_00030 [Burkholderia stagnalis]